MAKLPSIPPFSRILGSPQKPIVERSALGKIIEEQLSKFSAFCPSLRVLQYVIMPDHIHFAIFAQEYLPKALGSYIGMMKVKAGQQAKEQLNIMPPIFEKDFYDRILRRSHKLDTICHYIRQNPYRLLAIRHNPDFFRKINNIRIGENLWQAYGNLHLLDNPFKAPVVIHRADSDQLKESKLRRWSHLSGNGGILVSAFISPAEKEVRRQCEDAGGKIILISNEPFADRDKPAAHDFLLCTEGRLLILAPMQSLPPGRQTFLYLNSMAETIASPLSDLSSKPVAAIS